MFLAALGTGKTSALYNAWLRKRQGTKVVLHARDRDMLVSILFRSCNTVYEVLYNLRFFFLVKKMIVDTFVV